MGGRSDSLRLRERGIWNWDWEPRSRDDAKFRDDKFEKRPTNSQLPITNPHSLSFPKPLKILPQFFKIIFIQRNEIIAPILSAVDQFAIGEQFDMV